LWSPAQRDPPQRYTFTRCEVSPFDPSAFNYCPKAPSHPVSSPRENANLSFSPICDGWRQRRRRSRATPATAPRRAHRRPPPTQKPSQRLGRHKRTRGARASRALSRRVALAYKSTADFTDPTPDAWRGRVPTALACRLVGEVCAMQERARTWRQGGYSPSNYMLSRQARFLQSVCIARGMTPTTPRHRYMDQPCTTGARL
jgi:hypothetical protein